MLYHVAHYTNLEELHEKYLCETDAYLCYVKILFGGFYLWRTPMGAIQYGENFRANDEPGILYVMMIDCEPSYPEFEVDYEYSGHLAMEFLGNHEAELKEKSAQLKERGLLFNENSTIILVDGDRRRRLFYRCIDPLYYLGKGEIIADIMAKVNEATPWLFKSFVEQMLPRANAIKYLGDKMLPLTSIEAMQSFKKSAFRQGDALRRVS